MKVKLHGTRGSYPVSTAQNQKYGGNTPCVEVTEGRQRIIMDAGTGILGIDFGAYQDSDRIDIFLTHLHMDHIQGLAFCKPLFNPNQKIVIWGPADSEESLKTRLNRFLSPPLFPIPLRDIPSQLEICEMPNQAVEVGPFRILSEYISHPGPTLGYRVESGGKVLTYMPDHEPTIGRQGLYPEDEWVSGFDLAANADLLIHDSQYDAGEYQQKFGWGHSSLDMAVEYAERTGVKKLVLFHHDPNHSDAQLDEMFRAIVQNRSLDFSVEMAVQGAEIAV
ncbi:MBL fold metallo-hydrolase [Robiginitalea sp. SC105]|uniref:MBL fold metallo-hydrolase n=1 Tax=Robiginitalea sp. SC105 TaxID=2762332 RepID=UPI00163A9FB7|nr:MBL fold metallo-hydrolase [Robiginitalea sp. SC105]MBC2838451.1 MBL fold metallo-hydrolase [Robiginitalea sp. SC105]